MLPELASARLNRIVDDVVARARRHVDPRRVWLFGSQARGTAGRASDIDLAFEIPATRRRGWAAFVVEAADEVPALVNLDLVDLDDCDRRLAMEITTTGRLVYERSPDSVPGPIP